MPAAELEAIGLAGVGISWQQLRTLSIAPTRVRVAVDRLFVLVARRDYCDGCR
jgi:hypothetical protein